MLSEQEQIQKMKTRVVPRLHHEATLFPKSGVEQLPVDEFKMEKRDAIPQYLQGIEKVLAERGTQYGSFKGHADLTQSLKRRFYEHQQKVADATGQELTYVEREAIDMIFHKLGRIGNGNPHYRDNWVDLTGYPQLVVDTLDGKLT